MSTGTRGWRVRAGSADPARDLPAGLTIPEVTPSTLARLPADVSSPFDVYVNGVRQEPGRDFQVRDGEIVFDRELRKDRISGWRWFLGAWGVGTYRQNDSVDVRYSAPDGSPRVAEALELRPAP